ncbi:T9SS type A sorting domain-containing protein [bacterium]|nr:T9SS type A sorting domain-containing protein [bacterium]
MKMPNSSRFALFLIGLMFLGLRPAAAQIPAGKWFCVEATYLDTLLEGYTANFEILDQTYYEADFTFDWRNGEAEAKYWYSANAETLFTNLPKEITLSGGSAQYSGGKLVFDYYLLCTEEQWNKLGQTAIGYGFPGNSQTSQILFAVSGDSLLELKSVDGRTVLTYSFGAVKPFANPVVFRVNMKIQQALGLFNPGGGDKVFLRGDWSAADIELTEGEIPGVYTGTWTFPGSRVGTTLTYRFVVKKPGGTETAEQDPVRSYTVEPYGRVLGIAFFDRRARIDVTSPTAVADSEVNERKPSAAYNPATQQSLVVWQQDGNISGRLLNPDGSFIGPPFNICNSDFDQTSPDAAYNSERNEFLVVWQDDRGGNPDIYGIRLDEDGMPVTAAHSLADKSFIICDQDSNQTNPRVAYNYLLDKYLVIFQDERNTERTNSGQVQNIDVYGQRLDGDGDLLLPGSTEDTAVNFPVAFNTYYNEYYPDVAYLGYNGDKILDEWLVVYSQSEFYSGFGIRIWGVRIKGKNGMRMDTYGAEVPYPALGKPAGGPSGPPWLPQFPVGFDGESFYSMMEFLQGSPHAESNAPVPTAVLGKSAYDYRYELPEFFVTWSDFRDGAGDIYGQRLVLFPDSTAFRMGLKPERAADSLFTLVPVDRNGDPAPVPQNWMTWPNVPVCNDIYEQSWNNLAYSSGEGSFMVVWNDWRSVSWDGMRDWEDTGWYPPMADIYGQRLWLDPADSSMAFLDHDGTATGDPGMNTPVAFTEFEEGNMQYPAIAYRTAGNDFLVAYEFKRETDDDRDIYMDLYQGGSPFSPVNVDQRPSAGLPVRFTLSQNVPNPFNPATEISYTLPEADRVVLSVYNAMGQKILDLIDRHQAGGLHRASWDGKDGAGRILPSGLYFYRLQAGGRQAVRKMIFMR